MLDIDGDRRILCPNLEIRRVKLIQVRITTRREERCIPPLGHRRNFALQYINEKEEGFNKKKNAL